MREPDVQWESVSFGYEGSTGHVPVLDKVNLSVECGEIVAIVGATGCGKSTLLKLALGLERPISGRVKLSADRVAAGVGYVPQEPYLLPWRTAFQNAAVALEIAGREGGKPERDRVLELFARFGLSGKRDGLPRELSGGMRQRVAVIRCLAAHPRLIFMDEPFSAVDFVTRLEADTMLRYFCRDLGATVVVVTHNIEEAIFLGDRVVVMGGVPGRVVGEFDTTLSVTHDNAVNYRAAPEFGGLFRDIWKKLES